MRLLVLTTLMVAACSKARSLAPTVEQAKALMVELGIPCEDRMDALKCSSAIGNGYVNLDASDRTKVTSIEIYLQDAALLPQALTPYLPAGAMDGITARLTTPHGNSFTIEKVEILAEKSAASGVHVQIDYWDR